MWILDIAYAMVPCDVRTSKEWDGSIFECQSTRATFSKTYSALTGNCPSINKHIFLSSRERFNNLHSTELRVTNRTESLSGLLIVQNSAVFPKSGLHPFGLTPCILQNGRPAWRRRWRWRQCGRKLSFQPNRHRPRSSRLHR